MDLFGGSAALTQGCLEAGVKVASALDILYQTYGRSWDLSKAEHQKDAAYLSVFVFKPKVLHLGVQCTDYCMLGSREPSE